MPHIEVAKANVEQLRALAANQAIELEGGETKPEIRAKLTAAGVNDPTFFLPDASMRTDPIIDAVAPGACATKRIIIHEGDGQFGDEPVFVNHNGNTARIVRGEEVDVPVEYITNLEGGTKLDPVMRGGRVSGWRTVRRYPFSYV